ncbi:MAG: ORF6N domain-containing protein [Gammaproteobacteria bacterium]
MDARKRQRGKTITPAENIAQVILLIRAQKVILDADLARLYGVTTKRLNEQVRRNPGRFPEDFMFQLTKEEKVEVVANCDHLDRLKYSPTLPMASTEHGGIGSQFGASGGYERVCCTRLRSPATTVSFS